MDPLRMATWGAIAFCSALWVGVLHPEQLGVLLLKANLISLAAYAGYWIDRAAFPYARPHEEDTPILRSAAYQRRAIIIAGSMIAVALAI